ncbi:hypothetical protein [Pinisolibacter sp.]|uniref:hypothetical protein n=1 Tax=Pinisolibacter sp. TaxID=2172024 RepID=UPI002FDD6C02
MSDRRVGLLLIALGAAVCGLTYAVGEGLVTGVRAAWPAYLVGGVLVVIGLVNLRGSRETRRFPGDGRGPDADATGRLGGPVRPNPRLWRSNVANPHDPVHHLGGGEPNGRD